MKTHKPTTKTGADLLGYKTYQNFNSYNDGLTRVATADGELAKKQTDVRSPCGKTHDQEHLHHVGPDTKGGF
jgi:hypothetical protein